MLQLKSVSEFGDLPNTKSSLCSMIIDGREKMPSRKCGGFLVRYFHLHQGNIAVKGGIAALLVSIGSCSKIPAKMSEMYIGCLAQPQEMRQTNLGSLSLPFFCCVTQNKAHPCRVTPFLHL